MPRGVVVARLCGTSPLSTTGRCLLHSVCSQLSSALGAAIDVPSGFMELTRCFAQLLTRGTSDCPISIFIDSLDQLSDDDYACSEPWRWLPPILPPFVSVVVSCLPDDARRGASGAILSTLLAGKSAAAEIGPGNVCPCPSAVVCVEVKSMRSAEAYDMIISWLKPDRCLTAQQSSVLQRALLEAEAALDNSSGEHLTMLYLKLLRDRLVKVPSFKVMEPPPLSVAGLINQLFDVLEAEHGSLLVNRFVGLLCATHRRGLPESSLADLLSASDDVLCWSWPYVGRDQALVAPLSPKRYRLSGGVLLYHTPPVRRIPPLVLRRLLDGLQARLGAAMAPFQHAFDAP